MARPPERMREFYEGFFGGISSAKATTRGFVVEGLGDTPSLLRG
ncbi:MAG: hypothetical protein AAGF12_07705 [Myxococcota bacterium]